MNIKEMHDAFRIIGQQMGMQLNRGILPESIDVYLNNVIVEYAKEELLTGVHTALQEGVNTQPSTMSPVNTFRNLYQTARFAIFSDEFPSITPSIVSYYNKNNGYHIINIPTINSKVEVGETEFKISPMMYLGFSVEYDNISRGSAVSCRLIGADMIETTLRDMCNGATKLEPIVSLSSIPSVSAKAEQLGVISNEQLELYTNSKDCKVAFLNIKYIKTPNVVKYSLEDSKCVDCDLPAYTHFTIVERAVMKFYQSIGALSSNSKSNNQ